MELTSQTGIVTTSAISPGAGPSHTNLHPTSAVYNHNGYPNNNGGAGMPSSESVPRKNGGIASPGGPGNMNETQSQVGSMNGYPMREVAGYAR